MVFNSEDFKKILKTNNAKGLEILHLITFGNIPNKNIMMKNLNKFNGFNSNEFMIKLTAAKERVSYDEIECLFDYMQLNKKNVKKDEMHEKILMQLSNETIEYQPADNISIISTRSQISFKSNEIEISEQIEAIDEEILQLEMDLYTAEENLDQISPENSTGKRSLERKIKLLNVKITSKNSKKRTLEIKLAEEKTKSIPEIVHYDTRNDKGEYTRNWIYNDEENAVKSVSNKKENIQNSETLTSILVRQSIGMSLPEFHGKSTLEWKNFKLQYDNSTLQCKITPAENMIRLSKYLKGIAKEKVELLLISSKNPEDIIQILDSYYGGNDKIIKELIIKANKIDNVDSSEKLVDFNCLVQNISSTMNQVDGDNFDTQKLLGIFLKKLPQHVVLQWANHLMLTNLNTKNISFQYFAEWIKNISSVIQEVNFFTDIKTFTCSMNTEKENNNTKKFERPTTYNRVCKICKESEHLVEKCDTFLKYNSNKKWETVKKLHICFCCLKYHRGMCSKRQLCKLPGCTKYHHEILHKTETNGNTANCTTEPTEKVLLKILPVKLKGPKGISYVMAFLDEGSTVTLLDQSVSNMLGIHGKLEPFCFNWTDGITRHDPYSEIVEAEISAENTTTFHMMKDIRTVSNLNLPYQEINFENLQNKYPELKQLNISTALYTQKPMILIGQRHAALIISREIIEISNTNLLLSKTKLGWAIHGPISQHKTPTNFVCCQTLDDNLDEMVKQHFRLDNFGVCLSVQDKTKSEKEQRAIKIAQDSIEQTGTYYTIALPWIEDNIQLPDSRPLAFQRLNCLERKFNKDESLRKSYAIQIQALLQKNYAEKVSEMELEKKTKVWFLPHFGVFNPKKPEKPVRIVFDGAAKINNKCLNDFLLSGPDLLTSIIGVLIRFRQYKYAFSADIKEMFNRIKIENEDTFCQCFLWKSGKNIEIFKMTSMLFGINSSPFLAQFVKNFNAKKYQLTYPEAYQAIVKDHYVDDFLGSSKTIEEASKLIKDVIYIHKQANFEIRAFVSNSNEILQDIPKELIADEFLVDINRTENNTKVLGLLWNSKSDVFMFNSNFCKVNKEILNNSKIPTKRDVLKTTMSIYDPLGLLTPITIKARILMRKVWLNGIGWDDELTKELLKPWNDCLKHIKDLPNIKVPRCYNKNYNLELLSIELHIFNDASQQAYCSTAYLRYIFKENKYSVSLIFAKARVTPTSSKNMTIPKLELLAAVMGVRISKIIQREISLLINKVYYWTDSTTVLSWINSKDALKSFEAPRIGEILEYSKREQWHWLSTKDNVADDGTRENHETLKENSRWFVGPNFLYDKEENWKTNLGQNITSNEMVLTVTTPIVENEIECILDIQKFSKLYKLLRVTAWILRFVSNIKNRYLKKIECCKKDLLHLEEIFDAKIYWIQKLQMQCFYYDILKVSKNISSPNIRLSKQLTCIDNNVLKIKGRIDRAKDLIVETKRPIILDGRHHLTKLIIMEIHEKLFHFGVQSTINNFKLKYWMPQMVSRISKILRSCNWCKIQKSKLQEPLMGLLPENRFLTHKKPFYCTGIDFFGPFYVKIGRKTDTRYGVLFTCMTTRAIHVEIAHSLTTDSCILAIRRMMSRRGQIASIISDNGTNLKGANRELLEALQELYQEEVQQTILKYSIDWKFNPPAAPHFGGCWERLIGCFKKTLECILAVNRNPSDEVLSTVFAEAEYIINCRPYVLESNDSEDDLGFTPNNILIQNNIELYDCGKFTITDSILRKQWRISQYLCDLFWKKFMNQYIPSLIHQKKWTSCENLEVGEIVVVKDNTFTRGNWPLGVVVKTYPGIDGIVRVADIKTSRGIYKRCWSKIYRTNIKSKERTKTIIIEGNIGCGKTTLLQSLEKVPNIDIIFEPVDKWTNRNGENLLKNYYNNPKLWAVPFQKYVIETMAENHLISSDKIKIMERSIFCAQQCFIKYLLKAEIISEKEYVELCSQCTKLIKDNNITVDYIIYLKSDPEIAFNRIQKRNRIGEENINLKLILELDELLENYVQTTSFPVKIINANLSKENMKNEVLKFLNTKFLHRGGEC